MKIPPEICQHLSAEWADVRLKVTPKASKNAIGEMLADAEGRMALRVYVTTAPEKGKANQAVIALLARHFGVAKSCVCILSGDTSQHKVARITLA